MMTTTRQDQLDALRTVLEEQYEEHTRRLAELTVSTRQAHGLGGDLDTTAAMVARSRQALAEVARALRYMAEGRYGMCETCGGEIPMQRLRLVPQARFCVPCRKP